MKHVKIYENINRTVGDKIADICKKWRKSLSLDEFIVNRNKKSIYIKVYNEMNDYTFGNFQKLFDTLVELKCKWSYKDGRNLVVDFSNATEEDVDIYLNLEKYNL